MIVNRGEDSRGPTNRRSPCRPGSASCSPSIGLCSLVVGLTLFVAPQLGISGWAWTLTPLTARVCGAILTLPGMVNLWMLRDPRWSAFRQIFQAQLVSLALILLALALRGGELLWARPPLRCWSAAWRPPSSRTSPCTSGPSGGAGG